MDSSASHSACVACAADEELSVACAGSPDEKTRWRHPRQLAWPEVAIDR